MKTIKVKCKICGEVELESFYENDDGAKAFPVVYCPTELSVAKAWKNIEGSTYEESTGEKFIGVFKKQFWELSHEEVGNEGHSIGEVECWVEQI